MDVSYITFANARSRDHWNHPEMEIIEDNGDHESNKSLNIKKSNWFLTTDEYENVQDEKEEVKSNSIWLSMKNHDSECPKMSYENKFKRQLILLHPGSILLQNRRTLPE